MNMAKPKRSLLTTAEGEAAPSFMALKACEFHVKALVANSTDPRIAHPRERSTKNMASDSANFLKHPLRILARVAVKPVHQGAPFLSLERIQLRHSSAGYKPDGVIEARLWFDGHASVHGVHYFLHPKVALQEA